MNLFRALFTFAPLVMLAHFSVCAAELTAVSEDNCNFYLQLEGRRQCQDAQAYPSNYLVGYGYKYCTRFLALRTSWSPNLERWSRDTMMCLQRELSEREGLIERCEDLEQFAFESHSICYVDNGFCTLPTSEKITVLQNISCLDLLLKPRHSIAQALSLINHCTIDVDFYNLVATNCTLL